MTMKRLLLSLIFAGLLCSGCFAADACRSKTVGNVTLTTCSSLDSEMHLFISTSDAQTTTFYIAVRTSTGGVYVTADVEIQQVAHVAMKMTGKLAGKLQHITITELKPATSSAFSIDDGTLPQ